MKGRSLTKAERQLHDELRDHGCSVCRYIVKPDVAELRTPAIHHIDGKTKPGAHSKVIPLCDPHHQHGTADVVSLHSVNGKHGGKHQFQAAYGVTEYDLLAMCEDAMGYKYSEGVK